MSKEYGLILAGKKKPQPEVKVDSAIPKPSIFGSDSDSDGVNGAPAPKLKKQGPAIGPGSNAKRLAKKIQQKALEEDPTIFQYDELYDEMESKREEEKQAKKTEVKKAKYISRLLEFADKRKLENERRIERMVQKERDEEGEQFKDKESFVTSAYRKKLEELRDAEEKEKREEYLESIGDVTKQQDLGGFYRHIYSQKLGTASDSKEPEIGYTPISSTSQTQEPKKSTAKSRAYRKHKSSDDEETKSDKEDNTSPAKKAHIQSNLDADSDFSIDSSSDSEEEKEKPKEAPKKKEVISRPPQESAPGAKEPEVKEEPKEADSNGGNIIEEEKDVEPVKPKKNKEDIWKKRTVGVVFDDALQRYYERKAARNG